LWALTNKDIIYTKKQYKNLSLASKKKIEEYVYEDHGKIILLKDNARYWNHSCNPNAIHYWKFGMDIALRDIKKGEKMICKCGIKHCRRVIKREKPNSKIVKRLNERANDAAKKINFVKQPLLIILKKKHIKPINLGKSFIY